MRPATGSGRAQPHLLTVGHGELSANGFAQLLGRAGIEAIVDVRSIPRSRRHPQFEITELERWLTATGIRYRWEPALGGFRRAAPGSRNTALRHVSFRAYADYMETSAFHEALEQVLDAATRELLAVMCAETLWWRCHRRLIADAATILYGAEVSHLGHNGKVAPHRLTEGVRRDGDQLVYDASTTEAREHETASLAMEVPDRRH